jgi:DNA-binding LacI/PurR family transcriptional regulator
VINVDMLLNHRVAGIIVSISEETKNGNHFKRVLERKVPLVFFDRVCDDIDTTKVIIEDRKGAFGAVSYLINKGYKRIAHFAGPKFLSNANKRLIGYKEALKKNNILVNREYILYGGMNEEDGYRSMDKLLKMKKLPDAVFAVNDPVAVGAFQRIKEAGLKIPGDIALVGFSNNRLLTLIEPGITTVNQPSFEMGKKAAEVIIERIEKGKSSSKETIILDTELIIRDSA